MRFAFSGWFWLLLLLVLVALILWLYSRSGPAPASSFEVPRIGGQIHHTPQHPAGPAL